MTVVVCGPSGAGKTTLIQALLARPDVEIIDVFVCRKNPRSQEVGRVELTLAEFKAQTIDHNCQCSFEDTLYSFSIDQMRNSPSKFSIIDYPGDYPECSEFKDLNWIGILTLPPSEEILISRLQSLGKPERINGAIEEYREALKDLCAGSFAPEKWSVYKSEFPDSLDVIHIFLDSIEQCTTDE